MEPTEPMIYKAALGAIGLLTVGSFTTLMSVRDKVERMLILMTDTHVGVLHRLEKVEEHQKRHSDEIKAIRHGAGD